MIELKLKLPADFLQLTGINPDEAPVVIQRELAVYFFEQGVLTFSQARKLAQLSKWKFMALLRDRKVTLHYGLAEYKEDLLTIKELSKSS